MGCPTVVFKFADASCTAVHLDEIRRILRALDQAEVQGAAPKGTETTAWTKAETKDQNGWTKKSELAQAPPARAE